MNHAATVVLLCLTAVCLASDVYGAAATQPGRKRILVYTRNYVTNGKGFVHDNIQSSVDAIKKLGAENNFDVDVADDPNVFTPANLKQYASIVFSNANNEAFETQAQRDAFRRYIRGGGGFVGIHSASGCEREWPWFWSMLGGKFRSHPKIQPFEVRVADATHPATKDLPATFTWVDECYYLDNLDPYIRPLLLVDPSKLVDPKKSEYPGNRFGDSMPITWYHKFEGGRSFYTALGHQKEHYQDPLMLKIIRGGILWAMDGSPNPATSATTQK